MDDIISIDDIKNMLQHYYFTGYSSYSIAYILSKKYNKFVSFDDIKNIVTRYYNYGSTLNNIAIDIHNLIIMKQRKIKINNINKIIF